MYLSMLRMSCHALGLLLATVLCWNLCQGEIKFYSDDVTCSQNGTTKMASRQKTVSVIFCVQLGSTDVLNNDVYITQPSQPYSKDFWYRLNNTDRRLQVSSLTKSSYTTINITFTELEPRDFNEKFFVSIYRVDSWNSPHRKEVEVWFILKEETEGADKKITSITQTTSDNNEATTGATSVPSSGSNSSIPQEMLNYMYIAIAVVIVLILAVIIAVLIHRYRGRITKSSRGISDADDLNAYAEIRNFTINPGNEDDGKADKSLKETGDRESTRGDNSVDHLMSAHVDDKDTGRNISEQGLVYVTVVQATKQDKKKSEQASDKKKKPQETKQSPVVESVEYTTLDLEKSGKFKSAYSNVYLNQ